MAVLFPASQLRVLPYHRLVRDLGGRPPREVRDRLGRVGEWSPADAPVPPGPGTFCLYLDRRWHRLELPPASIDRGDPIRSLDVWLLQQRVLGPILGIDDPRTDPRIDFVGGIRGTGELERRVDSGEAALAVSMHPTTVEQLMAAADAGGDHASQEHLVRAEARQWPPGSPASPDPSGPSRSTDGAGCCGGSPGTQHPRPAVCLAGRPSCILGAHLAWTDRWRKAVSVQAAELVVSGAVKRFGEIEALRGIDLEIAAGEFFCVLGPSGAGKTTTLRSVAGLERLDAGHIHFGGQDLTHRPVRGRQMAMIFQTFALYPHLSVHDNLAYPLREARLDAAAIAPRVAATAEMLGIGHTLRRRPNTLSGGEQQRVAIGGP